MSKVTPENFHQYAGYRACRKARSTETVISLVDGKEQGFDTSAGRWYTICEEHGTTVSHGSLTLASSHTAAPEGWCEGCRAVWDEKQRRVQKLIDEIKAIKGKPAASEDR